MSWLQLQFAACAEHTERISAVLEAAGAVAVSVQAADDEALLEPAPGEQPLWRHNAVCGLFTAQADPRRLTRSLARELEGLVGGPPVVRRLQEQDWLNAWRDQAVTRQFADGVWVIPTDGEAPAQARAVLRLDPGLAFGTGAHPTTALCLEWLAQRQLSDRVVIDYGCGSGILAIAAALLGARQVIAVDYDTQARTATLNNARINGVAERIHICVPEAIPVLRADCLLANILANALFDLYDELVALTRPGAGLALSGILPAQAQRLLHRYRQRFIMDAPRNQQDWILLTGTRGADQG